MKRFVAIALGWFVLEVSCSGSSNRGLPLDDPDAATSGGTGMGSGGTGDTSVGGRSGGNGGSSGGGVSGTSGRGGAAGMGTGGMAAGTGGTPAGGGVPATRDAAMPVPPPPPKPPAPDSGPPMVCNAGAACTADCTDLCMNKLGTVRCTCVGGMLFCGGCMLPDGGAPPDCPANAPDMMCGANDTLCRWRPEVGNAVTCSCKGDGAKRTWRCG